MAKRKVNLAVELSGEQKYKQAISELNAANKTLGAEMKRLAEEYKGNEKSMDFLSQKGDILQRQWQQQHEKVEQLKEALDHAKEAYGENSATTQKYLKDLYDAEAAEFKLQHAIDANNEALQGQNEEMIGLGDTVDQLASKLGINLPDGAKNALNGMNSLSAGTVAAMGAAAAAIAVAVKAVKELSDMTIEAAHKVDEYLTESKIYDIPTQMLQAWDYAAPLIDVDAETMKGAMTKITKAMGDAKDGSESAIEKFRDLGVEFQNADGSLRSAEDVFYDVVDALGQVENATERDAAAMELMGKSAQDLNPLIEAGSGALKEYYKEAEAVGYILSNDQMNALGEVDDMWQRLQLTIEANKMKLAAEFAPAAKDALELFCEWTEKAGQYLVDSGMITNLSAIVQNLVSILKTAGEMLSGLPSFKLALDGLKVTLGAIADFTAVIADAFDLITGLLNPSTWGSGQIKNALGFGYDSGNANNLQRTRMQQEGTWQEYQDFYKSSQWSGYTPDENLYGYDSTTGLYYDLKTGNYLYGHNASGNDNWRGGLTWVGESGPELVALPQGSQILNAQESRNHDQIHIENLIVTIDAHNVKDFNDVVDRVLNYEFYSRMDINPLMSRRNW